MRGSARKTRSGRIRYRAGRSADGDLKGEAAKVARKLPSASSPPTTQQRPVVCIARVGTQVHFDVSGLRILYFTTYRSLEEQLVREFDQLLIQ